MTFHGGWNLGAAKRYELREAFGKHQVAMLDFNVPRGASVNRIPPEMTPVLHRWGYAPGSLRSFVGYVNHHEIIDGPDDDSVLRVFAVGTSLTMNDPNPRSWTRVSGSYVAREIGNRHGLRTVTHKAPEVLDYWTQGNESDFAMMIRLADRTGFRFWVDGSTQYFLDPQRLVRTPNLNDLLTFTMDGFPEDGVKRLHTISGSLSPSQDSMTRSEVYGIDSASGRLVKATSDRAAADRGYVAPASRTITGYAVDNAFEARRITEAALSTGTWVTLEAQVRGNSKVRLGDVIQLKGSRLPNGSAGLWLVAGATQVQDMAERRPMTLSTTLQLTRNQKDHLSYSTSTLLRAPRTVAPVLRDTGRWEAQVLEDVYV